MGIYQETEFRKVSACTAKRCIGRKRNPIPAIVNRNNRHTEARPTVRQIHPSVAFAVGRCIRAATIRYCKAYPRHIADNLHIESNRLATHVERTARELRQINVIIPPNTTVTCGNVEFCRFHGITAYNACVNRRRTSVDYRQATTADCIVSFGVYTLLFKMQVIEVDVKRTATIRSVQRCINLTYTAERVIQDVYVHVYSQPAVAQIFAIMSICADTAIERKHVPKPKLAAVVHEVEYDKPTVSTNILEIEYHVAIRQIIGLIKRNRKVRKIARRNRFQDIQGIRAVFASVRRIVRDCINAAVFNGAVPQVNDIRFGIRCRIRCISLYSCYTVIPTCEHERAFACVSCSRRIARHVHRCTKRVFRCRNYAAIPILEGNRMRRRGYKMQVIEMEIAFTAAIRRIERCINFAYAIQRCAKRIQVYVNSNPSVADIFAVMCAFADIRVQAKHIP